MARRLGTTITAQHIIDSHSAWEFLGHENPGFLKSIYYLEAYQQLVSSLFVLGEALMADYASKAKELGIDAICLKDEGNPITEICRQAANHKLVVIGHKKSNAQFNPRSQYQRLSVAEALAHDCPRPLLVVQDECKKWTSMSIMISVDHINKVYVDSCLDMAEALNLPAILLCLTGGANEEDPLDFVKNMRESDERLRNLPIALAPAEKDIDVSLSNWFAPEGVEFEKELWDNTLAVIPTRMVAGERLTVVDSSPSMFVRHLELPSILLWPEEYVYSTEQTAKEKELSAVG
jgi:nucleotide-binding universal stress UspA family protein